MNRFLAIPLLLTGIFLHQQVQSQILHEYNDSVVLSNGHVAVVLHTATGKLDYHFANGVRMDNTIAYLQDIHLGRLLTTDCNSHPYSVDPVQDSLGKGLRLNIKHMDADKPFWLLQQITLYEEHSPILVALEAGRNSSQGPLPETREISPLAILPEANGQLFQPGEEPRVLDEPFDNDDWVGVVERHWPDAKGISYEFTATYDNRTFSGLVIGSLMHDFWKTGLAYRTASKGALDSFVVYGGAATRDNPALPHAYGGQDGTHDYAPHGTMTGAVVYTPLLFLDAERNINDAFRSYGLYNAQLNGRLAWKGSAPVYWNSFGVEGVLGYSKIMMPPGVGKVADFIHTLDNFNRYAKPVLSIDSYDQSIYTTELLAALSKYGKKLGQQMGFYFTPFAIWTWKNGMDQAKVPGTDISLKDVVLKDEHNVPIPYKDGDWGAFPLDPTHPATRQYIITQLQKAKAINARFIKIDFLTAGTLEANRHYDPAVRSGMQAYDQGMSMLKHLVDSIMGPDIFITEAISPLFPNQYAHTRFNSTDVYSHLRDDEPGFPNWGSTESSLASGSHLTWVQGTLFPFTNMDVTIMKAFQKNPDLSETEIKVRLYALMVMGSILGDGSDFRQPLAAQRARQFLNNPTVDAFFSHPVAFTPLQWADGDSYDQQMSFYLSSPALLAIFNFSGKDSFQPSFDLSTWGLSSASLSGASSSDDRLSANRGADHAYIIRDFLTNQVVGRISKGQQRFTLTVPVKDALMVKLVPEP